jgi:trk system potassium uptake protein TrkH
MASNGGLTSGIVAADMPAGLEALYIIMMWAGRLEFVTLLALMMKIIVSVKEGVRTLREEAE